MTHPRVFISYAWDGPDHAAWVRALASRLRSDGVDVVLDQWDAAPGDLLPHFMETQIREADFVLVLCTPKYKAKSNSRSGGVGYEGDVITAELFLQSNRRKFIPILCAGQWQIAAPSWLSGAYYIDLSSAPYSPGVYEDLLRTLHGRRGSKPPLGAKPAESVAAPPPSAAEGWPAGAEAFAGCWSCEWRNARLTLFLGPAVVQAPHAAVVQLEGDRNRTTSGYFDVELFKGASLVLSSPLPLWQQQGHSFNSLPVIVRLYLNLATDSDALRGTLFEASMGLVGTTVHLGRVAG